MGLTTNYMLALAASAGVCLPAVLAQGTYTPNRKPNTQSIQPVHLHACHCCSGSSGTSIPERNQATASSQAAMLTVQRVTVSVRLH